MDRYVSKFSMRNLTQSSLSSAPKCPGCYNGLYLSNGKPGPLFHRPRESPFPCNISAVNSENEGGCGVCLVLFRGIKAVNSAWLEHPGEGWLSVSNRRQSFELVLRHKEAWDLNAFNGTGETFEHSAPFHGPRFTFTPTPQNRVPKSIYSKHFGDDDSLKVIHRLLDKCCQSHDQVMCRRPAEAVLPTRILDLEAHGASPDLQLIEPGPGTKAKYMALSHCWGKSSFQTLTENLRNNMERIDLRDLPRTFMDAIIVAKKLHIRYIWIDSLCIIQNDPEDWRKEAARVCDVYRNAFVTLAAASSADDRMGFLKERPREILGTFVSSSDNGGPDFHVRREPQHYRTSRYDLGVKSHSAEPLETRGWTLQEDLLSRRLITFGTSEMTWECGESLKCECGDIFQASGGPEYTKLLTRVMRNSRELYQAWDNICTQYSRRKLTFARDKLPALSGIANAFRELMPQNDIYAAGHWQRDLPRSLLWRHDVKPRPSTQTQNIKQRSTYLSPTWSWAGLDGGITYDHVHQIYWGWDHNSFMVPLGGTWFTTVKEVAVTLTDSSNPTGGVDNGSLLLEGPLVQVVLRHHGHTNRFVVSVIPGDSSSEKLQHVAQEAFKANVYLDVPFNLKVGTEGNSENVYVRSLPIYDAGSEITLWGIIMREQVNPDKLTMILLGKSLRDPTAYERLGLVDLYEKSGFGWVTEIKKEAICIL